MKHSLTELVNRFNTSETIIFISKYPYLDLAESHHGVATYTQHVVQALATKAGKKCVVLVQAEYDRPWQTIGRNILIIPAFGPGLGMFGQLFQWLNRFDQAKVVHIHSEFYTSGQAIQMASVVPFLASLKLLRKEVYFTAHNVVDDFSFIATHLGKKRQDLSLRLLEKMTPAYYWSLAQTVKKIIVLDESVFQRLLRFIPAQKLYLSPHWIKPVNQNPKLRSRYRAKLGFSTNDLVLICFGFMTKYKGVDWLVETVAELRKLHGRPVKLILAGGKAPSQQGKTHYETFYAQLTRRVAQLSHVILTDFIPESELDGYFAAADIVVLPYRGILGASGTWAQALAHQKPFLLSEELQAYLDGPTIKNALDQAHLTKSNLTFLRRKGSFIRHLHTLLQEKQLLKLAKFSKELATERSPEQRLAVEIPEIYTPASSQVQWEYVVRPTKALAALWNR